MPQCCQQQSLERSAERRATATTPYCVAYMWIRAYLFPERPLDRCKRAEHKTKTTIGLKLGFKKLTVGAWTTLALKQVGKGAIEKDGDGMVR
eukprot:409026-Pelagomonas_calceolata.AAC.3